MHNILVIIFVNDIITALWVSVFTYNSTLLGSHVIASVRQLPECQSQMKKLLVIKFN